MFSATAEGIAQFTGSELVTYRWDEIETHNRKGDPVDPSTINHPQVIGPTPQSSPGPGHISVTNDSEGIIYFLDWEHSLPGSTLLGVEQGHFDGKGNWVHTGWRWYYDNDFTAYQPTWNDLCRAQLDWWLDLWTSPQAYIQGLVNAAQFAAASGWGRAYGPRQLTSTTHILRPISTRTVSALLSDFRSNPGNWIRVSASATSATSRRARGGVSVTSIYRHKTTGETFVLHDVFTQSGASIPKHPTIKPKVRAE